MLSCAQIYPVEITGYTADGQGVAHIDGQAVFIPNTIAGERCTIRPVHIGKTHAVGKLEQVLQPSPHRLARACPYAKLCGGCDFWHMDYAEETRLKAERVAETLRRIGGFDPGTLSIAGAPVQCGYRNKALFPVAELRGRAEAGFYRARTHRVIPIDRCLIQTDAANCARQAVVEFLRRYRIPVYDETTHQGLVRHIYVRSGAVTGQVQVCLVVNGRSLPHARELTALLRQRVPGLRSVVLGVNTRPGSAVLGDEFLPLWGEGQIEDELCGLRFSLSPRSFYQVNHDQAQLLYEKAIALAGLTGRETVLDLYCGTGTITLAMARHAGSVIGVELVSAAIDDARRNARRNGIENARFFCADAAEAAARLAAEGTRPDVVVVDPPRKGLSADVPAHIAAMAPQRVVYVSCDPATLARDLTRFRAQGYEPRHAEAVDLFPRCAHVETVALLSRR